MDSVNGEVRERLTPEEAYRIYKAIVAEVDSVVIGKHYEIVLLVAAMLAGGHVLIEDVPGVGKTTLAASLARAAGLSFKRAQFTRWRREESQSTG